MSVPVNINMPAAPDLGPNFTLRVTALDPTTGSQVPGVNIGTVVIEAAGEGDLSSGSFQVGNPILIGISV